MCDCIGISSMYDFICLYSIAYAYDASAEAERKKNCVYREDNARMSAQSLYFAPFNTE